MNRSALSSGDSVFYSAFHMESVILASASPQRKALLEGLGLPFTVAVSTVDEDGHPERSPRDRALVLAQMKAQEVAAKHPGAFVIGCDTLVVTADGDLHEKPANADEARRMIGKQSGRACVVHSGLCVIGPSGAYSDVSSSTVHFTELSSEQIDWWISTNLWQGRSGAFQIDGPGQLMIEKLEGDWTSVVGLPVFLLGRLLEQAGYPLWK